MNKRDHVAKILALSKIRAGRQKLAINLTLDYLFTIAPDNCPVFKQPLKWGTHNEALSPVLDRVQPDKGYIKGNVAWISARASTVKAFADTQEMYAVADWTQEVTKQIEKYGGVLPPAYDDPAFTHTTKPSNFVIDTALDTRQRGGY